MDLGAFACFAVGNTVECGGYVLAWKKMEWRLPKDFTAKRKCKVLYLSNPFPAPVSSTTKDKIMKLSTTTSTFADLELFAIQYDFLIMKVKSSSLMLMLALFRSWEKFAILIQHSQLFERWDTFRYVGALGVALGPTVCVDVGATGGVALGPAVCIDVGVAATCVALGLELGPEGGIGLSLAACLELGLIVKLVPKAGAPR
uniref:Uncharacterized protein n=1 Tax=Solanum tuberosum TaxID=4113 RepID=M1B385_SOLTU